MNTISHTPDMRLMRQDRTYHQVHVQVFPSFKHILVRIYFTLRLSGGLFQ